MTPAPVAVARGEANLFRRTLRLIRNLPGRLHEGPFWITQGGVLAVTAIHIVAEAWSVSRGLTVPSALHHIPVVLYLAPISYASLRFGTEGAVLTGVWSAVLTLPNLLIFHPADFEWLEVLYVGVVIAAGILLSVPVERERRQRRQVESANHRLTLLNDIATLTLTADLGATLNLTLYQMVELLDLEGACVIGASREGKIDPILACHPPEVGVGSLSAQTAQPDSISSPDVSVFPLTAELPGSGQGERVGGSLAVKTKAGDVLGKEDRRLLEGVASHLAIAVANQQLTEAERRRVRSYARMVTQAQEEERKRIARELHDEAAQNLVVIRRDLAALAASLNDAPITAELKDLTELAAQTLAGMRRFSRDLRPPTLEELGLPAALDQLIAQVRERSGLAADFGLTGRPRRLTIETELSIYRIGQAALHNAERHARASEVTAALTFHSQHIDLEILDDGCGFSVPRDLADLPGDGKLGLVGMHERAQLVGGSLQIRSSPGAGTRVSLHVPA